MIDCKLLVAGDLIWWHKGWYSWLIIGKKTQGKHHFPHDQPVGGGEYTSAIEFSVLEINRRNHKIKIINESFSRYLDQNEFKVLRKE